VNGHDDITPDTFFGGAFALRQLPRGEYRTNVDALLLAHFAAEGRRAQVCVDLGAGVGPVALALLHYDAAERIVLVERHGAAARLAQANAEATPWRRRAEVFCTDVADAALPPGVQADLIVCNPPYFSPAAMRTSSSAHKLAAKAGDLPPFLHAARRLLGRRGRACFVYPASSWTELIGGLEREGLVPKRARFVYARRTAPARAVLVEAQPGKPGGLVVDAPWFERETCEDGEGYSPGMRALLAGIPPTRARDRYRVSAKSGEAS
jgi:tRNA1Val (adenine37-N6)-methyltransferase